MRATDIVIVGGGMSGSVAAAVLGRRGYDVTLVDLHAVFPDDMRAEVLSANQLKLLKNLGIAEPFRAAGIPVRDVVGARFGKVVDRKRIDEVALPYQDMVATARAQIPSNVHFIVGRVADLTTGPEHQRVELSNGEVIHARLIVLATGLGEALRRKLGVTRRVIRPNHALTMGFDIAPAAGGPFNFTSLVYYGERVQDRFDYVHFFPRGAGRRANLFCYRDPQDAWVKSFVQRPEQTLLETVPGIRRFLGDFRVSSKVDLRPVDLMTVENYCREGVVLVGDSFRTSSPPVGTGVTRLLTDIDQLASVHLPNWFATPGMTIEKIAQFYADPVKQACDSDAAHGAEYRRSAAVETGLGWELHRRQVYLRRRVANWLSQLSPEWRTAEQV